MASFSERIRDQCQPRCVLRLPEALSKDGVMVVGSSREGRRLFRRRAISSCRLEPCSCPWHQQAGRSIELSVSFGFSGAAGEAIQVRVQVDWE
jgi:hypothetical protein